MNSPRSRRPSVDERLTEIVERRFPKNWKRAAVVKKHRAGMSIRRASIEVGVSWRAARKWVLAFDASPDVGRLLQGGRGRPPVRRVWTSDERAELQRIKVPRSHRDRRTEARHIATVGLAVSSGYSNQEIARMFRPRWKAQRVARWRARFIKKGLDCIPAKWRQP